MLEVQVAEDHSPCEFAKERYNGIARFRFLWTLLLFIFGAFLVLFLVAVFALAIAGEPVAAAIGAAGTVVDGAGVLFLKARRDQAKREEEAAYDDVVDKCGEQLKPALDQVRQGLRVFGVN